MNSQEVRAQLMDLHSAGVAPEVRCSGPAHTAWRAKSEAVIRLALGPDSPTLRAFQDVRYSIGVWTGAPGEAEADQRFFADGVDEARALIEAAAFEIGLSNGPEVASGSPSSSGSGTIFIVHGRDDARKNELARLLEKTVELRSVILHEQPSRGATIIEKLEANVWGAEFAVVLMTGDDEGRLRDGLTRPARRARQNVIFEAGLLMGILGRARTVLLIDEDVEPPSDLDGVMYIRLDAAGAWRLELLKEIKAAGIRADTEQIP